MTAPCINQEGCRCFGRLRQRQSVSDLTFGFGLAHVRGKDRHLQNGRLSSATKTATALDSTPEPMAAASFSAARQADSLRALRLLQLTLRFFEA